MKPRLVVELLLLLRHKHSPKSLCLKHGEICSALPLIIFFPLFLSFVLLKLKQSRIQGVRFSQKQSVLCEGI